MTPLEDSKHGTVTVVLDGQTVPGYITAGGVVSFTVPDGMNRPFIAEIHYTINEQTCVSNYPSEVSGSRRFKQKPAWQQLQPGNESWRGKRRR